MRAGDERTRQRQLLLLTTRELTSPVSKALAEQNAARAVEFANRVYLLQRGRIVLDAAAEDLADRMNEIAELYLGSGRETTLLESQ